MSGLQITGLCVSTSTHMVDTGTAKGRFVSGITLWVDVDLFCLHVFFLSLSFDVNTHTHFGAPEQLKASLHCLIL